MIKLFARAVLVLIVTSTSYADSDNPAHSYKPPEGYVPDARTAELIAEAVLIPISGEATIAGERPFTATLKNGIWTVQGFMPDREMAGGVAVIEISRSDGRVLRVTHGK